MEKLTTVRVRIRALVVLITVALLGFFGVMPANAAGTANTLPTGDALYVVDADGTGIYQTAADGSQIKLDAQMGDFEYGLFAAASYNYVDGFAYLVYTETEIAYSCYLDKVDLTGASPAVRVPVTNVYPTPYSCFGLNIDVNGNALLSWYDDDSEYFVSQLDLVTGELSSAVNIDEELYGLTVDPSGAWFGLTSLGHLVSIDSTTGAFTTLVSTDLNDVYDFKMDKNGVAWFTDNPNDNPPFPLYSWKSGDVEYTDQGDTSVNGDTSAGKFGPTFVGVETKKSELPNTGVNAREVVVTGGISLAAIVVGLVVAGSVRRRDA